MLTEKEATSPISAITSKTCSPSRCTGVALSSGAALGQSMNQPPSPGSLLHDCNERGTERHAPPAIRGPEPSRWQYPRSPPDPTPLILDPINEIDKIDRPRWDVTSPFRSNSPGCKIACRYHVGYATSSKANFAQSTQSHCFAIILSKNGSLRTMRVGRLVSVVSLMAALTFGAGTLVSTGGCSSNDSGGQAAQDEEGQKVLQDKMKEYMAAKAQGKGQKKK